MQAFPLEFLLFALTLLGVALFHRRTLQVALTGLGAIVLYKLAVTGFATGPGVAGLGLHFAHKWAILANLLLLLTGFALLSRHFEESRVPDAVVPLLPSGWLGGATLLGLVFVLSSFLDNIAAAVIGATMAGVVFRHRVHIGYLAAIVASANAGGAGSVLGDTTTTMMWIAGVPAFSVLDAFVASIAAFLVFSVPASMQQHRHSPILPAATAPAPVDWLRVLVVAAVLLAALGANLAVNRLAPNWGERLPILGLTVWAALLIMAPVRRPDWAVLPEAAKGSVFLLSLVASASLMPVNQLPAPSWASAFGLGFLSSVFDNIPLTALALKQGGYDWGVLAFAVGYGGSMVWFGSSAGVAVSNIYPEAKSVGQWIRAGWAIPLGYVIGFFVMLGLMGWHPA